MNSNFQHIPHPIIVSFTRLGADSTAEQILRMLDDLYTLFDNLLDKYDAYKVETVGDAYMVVSGCPHPNADHAEVIADFALNLLKKVETDFVIQHKPDRKLQIRIGIHTGPTVAGVVGVKMPRYCLFGDTVNTASRMETNSLPGKILVSDTTFKLLNETGRFILKERDMIDVRNRGPMITHWLMGFHVDNKLSVQAIEQESRRKTVLAPPYRTYRRTSRLLYGNFFQPT